MPTIKRYANRKLYNTETGQYITLDGITALIRAGADVQVVDNVTGEDLTALTLSQIIFEQEKKKRGFLPQAVLTGLIQAGGDTLAGLRQTLATPLNLLHQVDEEIKDRVQTLINQDELAEQEGRRLLKKLLTFSTTNFDETALDESLAHLLERRGIPSQDEVARLTGLVEALIAKLDTLDNFSQHTTHNE